MLNIYYIYTNVKKFGVNKIYYKQMYSARIH